MLTGAAPQLLTMRGLIIQTVTPLAENDIAFVPLSQAQPGERHLLVEPGDDVLAHAAAVEAAARIAIAFPKFTDGRGYSSATLLRTRLGYRGPLRAVGDVLVDQLYLMARVGIDEFALRADQSVAAARRALAQFSVQYQGAVDQPLPLFVRHAGKLTA
jgi:uncharacterized protein (DUF934 family)